jgi:hypothetical protein
LESPSRIEALAGGATTAATAVSAAVAIAAFTDFMLVPSSSHFDGS